jgi:uncharacterized protein (TIGR00369 family)
MDLPPLTAQREAFLREIFSAVKYAAWLGLQLEELSSGRAVISLLIAENHKQNLGVVHGGAIASLLDTAAAFAVMTVLREEEKATTTDLCIQYLRPLTHGRARAEARVRRAGRRLVSLAVDVFDENQALTATAITTYLRF